MNKLKVLDDYESLYGHLLEHAKTLDGINSVRQKGKRQVNSTSTSSNRSQFQKAKNELMKESRVPPATWKALTQEQRNAKIQETRGTAPVGDITVEYDFRQRAEQSFVQQAYFIGPSIGTELIEGLRFGASFYIMYGNFHLNEIFSDPMIFKRVFL